MKIKYFHTLAALGLVTSLFVSPAAMAEETMYWPKYPTVNYGTGKQAERIQHGEYLVKAGDCISCHTDTTKPDSPVFAGGLGMRTPFGTFYSPNITPDKETGLGKWSLEDFKKAMHRGKRPDGSNNFPVFPFLWFTRVSDEDLNDIKAYLDAIPAIHQENKKENVPFPFNVRFAQTFWRLLFFKEGYFQPDPQQSAQWNRGAYLVEGLAHCGMCHTPINLLGGPQNTYKFTGNMVDGMLAPNISGPALKDASVDDIIKVFTEEKMIGGGQVAGPMLEADRNSLQHLNRSDLEAIAVYIKSVQSKQPKKKEITGTGLEAGKAVYEQSCYACHNTGASGAPQLGNAEEWASRIESGTQTLYHNAIVGIKAMPPKGTCSTCTDQQIQDAVDYIVQMAKPGAHVSTSSFGRPSEPPPGLTLVDGKKMYEEHCASCHSSGQRGTPQIGDVEAWKPKLKQGISTLVFHSLKGYNAMPSKQQTCPDCSDADILAAVIYIAQESKSGNEEDYKLWLSN